MTTEVSRFAKFVESSEQSNGLLPFIHTTRAFKFNSIRLKSILTPTHCDVFHRDLLYMFYGRPSYKVKTQANPRLAHDWPIVFIFKPENIIAHISNVFPFDSGAFSKGMYGRIFDKENTLDDFILPGSFESIKQVVGAFYRNEFEYLTGNSRKNVDIPLSEFEAAGVHELARAPASPSEPHRLQPDERSSSIEILLDSSVEVKGNISHLIFPENFLSDDEIVKCIRDWDCEFVPYSLVGMLNPDAFIGTIYQTVINIYRKSGLI